MKGDSRILETFWIKKDESWLSFLYGHVYYHDRFAGLLGRSRETAARLPTTASFLRKPEAIAISLRRRPRPTYIQADYIRFSIICWPEGGKLRSRSLAGCSG